MNNNDEGVKEYLRRRLLEAIDAGDLKRIRDELKTEGQKPGSIDAVVSELRRKGNLKFGATDTGSFYPIKVGKGEIIAPEAALHHIRLQDGDYKLGFVDGMGVLIMAARYNQLLAASQAETLSNQLKIMEEARKGSAEVAQEAAARAAASVGAQIMPEVQALKNQIIASSSNPMMTMFAQTMQPLLGQVMGNMMGVFQPKAGQPQPGAQAGQPGQLEAQQPVGQQASEEEVNEAFQ